MSNNLRVLLHKKISQAIQNEKSFKPSTVTTNLKLKQDKSSGKLIYILPLRSQQYNISDEVPNLLKHESDDFLEHVETDKENRKLNFRVHQDHYIKGVVDSLHQKPIAPPDFMRDKPNNVVVEFSSPNIAKPFHVGHLRSTIIGNCIANVNDFFQNNVKRINYLGDWGTQFGFVQLGLSLSKVPEETLKKDPINALYNAYVYANKLAEEDPTIAEKARDVFMKLESGDKSSLSEWETFRNYTLDELGRTYNRIGIKFDEYQWESMYNMKAISGLMTELERLNLMVTDDQNRKVIHLNEKKTVPIVKSDGSSLYITRDIGAAIDRFEKYKFDSMYYVVDNGQSEHFTTLVGILSAMKLPWADRLRHIKFGRIRGMSTRKGTAVFLQDILDETRAVMKEKQIESPTTKVNLDYEDPSTEVLGVSAVVINDLRHKRTHDYDFDWNTALDVKGDTGVSLQYTHCRLVSLEENCGATIASECIPELLAEPSAVELALFLGQFDEAVMRTFREHEPYVLVHYLFKLSRATSKALSVLRIKDEPAELASQRLLLMHTTRKVLAQGMKLLGLTPLNKM